MKLYCALCLPALRGRWAWGSEEATRFITCTPCHRRSTKFGPEE